MNNRATKMSALVYLVVLQMLCLMILFFCLSFSGKIGTIIFINIYSSPQIVHLGACPILYSMDSGSFQRQVDWFWPSAGVAAFWLLILNSFQSMCQAAPLLGAHHLFSKIDKNYVLYTIPIMPVGHAGGTWQFLAKPRLSELFKKLYEAPCLEQGPSLQAQRVQEKLGILAIQVHQLRCSHPSLRVAFFSK